ncbi:FtsW/RodA/SpoVE family cell cycle protein [Proteiniclasticum sp. BAD-10]|uniref:FtsW/RodA/SpoVE family cell cycle protein n=1 Tax=Proteiniclasticum sediminis TaxID=2804028 RepID=A0A941CR23_9CLOT|nr:FtsW/RodA/SpoVE family cell cycle protein [Proteiniclasticum sediminis]MBR0577340.1 FtsW/RodA/SpoVE family cell cycle protein [Proteiniclasticum sediminis]
MKDAKVRMLIPIYLLTFALFFNIALLRDPFDAGALIMAAVMCVLIGYAHLVVNKFFSHGDKFLVTFVSVLPVIGIAVLYRLDPNVAVKQVLWFIIGISTYISLVILLPDLNRFARYKYLYLAGTLIFMSMATFFGITVYGAKNWVDLGFTTFQPSEFGKIFFVFYLASSLKNYTDLKSLIEPGVVVVLSLGFMVLQRDLGSAMIFTFIAITMLYTATSRIKYLLASFGLGAVGAVMSYALFPHIRRRVMIWRKPWEYAGNESYQIVQGLYAMASGGLFGRGLGLGSPQYIPINKSDYIFAVIVEELGMIFALGILIIYFLMFFRNIRTALKAKSTFTSLLVVGFSVMVAMQVIVIIGGVMNMIPLTGITLPLISYGGTSMLTVFFCLGIIQKISEEV